MARLGGTDKVVGVDVEAFPEVAELGRVLVAELLWRLPGGFGRFLDLLAVLVGAGEQMDLGAADALGAGQHVGGDGRVGVTDVGGGVDVIERGRDVYRLVVSGGFGLQGRECQDQFGIGVGFQRRAQSGQLAQRALHLRKGPSAFQVAQAQLLAEAEQGLLHHHARGGQVAGQGVGDGHGVERTPAAGQEFLVGHLQRASGRAVRESGQAAGLVGGDLAVREDLFHDRRGQRPEGHGETARGDGPGQALALGRAQDPNRLGQGLFQVFQHRVGGGLI